MKILSLLGSPRKGNSEILLNYATNICKEKGHEVINLNPSHIHISGCIACEACSETGKCVVEDDMNSIYPLLEEADRIIIVSPIFFFGLPAQLKSLIDRCQCLWYEKYVLKKRASLRKRKALLILVGGMKKGEIGVTCAEATVKAFLRTIDVKEQKTLSYLGYNEAGEILKNEKAFADIVLAVDELLKND